MTQRLSAHIPILPHVTDSFDGEPLGFLPWARVLTEKAWAVRECTFCLTIAKLLENSNIGRVGVVLASWKRARGMHQRRRLRMNLRACRARAFWLPKPHERVSRNYSVVRTREDQALDAVSRSLSAHRRQMQRRVKRNALTVQPLVVHTRYNLVVDAFVHVLCRACTIGTCADVHPVQVIVVVIAGVTRRSTRIHERRVVPNEHDGVALQVQDGWRRVLDRDCPPHCIGRVVEIVAHIVCHIVHPRKSVVDFVEFDVRLLFAEGTRELVSILHRYLDGRYVENTPSGYLISGRAETLNICVPLKIAVLWKAFCGELVLWRR